MKFADISTSLRHNIRKFPYVTWIEHLTILRVQIHKNYVIAFFATTIFLVNMTSLVLIISWSNCHYKLRNYQNMDYLATKKLTTYFTHHYAKKHYVSKCRNSWTIFIVSFISVAQMVQMLLREGRISTPSTRL